MKRFYGQSIPLILALACTAAPAQKASKLSATIYKVLLENEQVRVLEVRCSPGDKEPMHSHPAFVAYTIKPGRYRELTPFGEAREGESKGGSAIWVEALAHGFECLTDQHYVITELKNAARP